MKSILNLYLGHEGCERLAKAGANSYWHWHILVRVEAIEQNGQMAAPPHGPVSPPENAVFLGSFTVDLPSTEEAITSAAEGIKNELSLLRAAKHVEEQKLHARLNELLSLTYEDPSK